MRSGKSSASWLVAVIILLLLGITTMAQVSDTALLTSLKARLSAGELAYIELKTKPEGFLKTAGEALPWITAVFAMLSLLLQQYWQRKRDRETQLYNGLSWFEGGAQKRSIGIALIEANWNEWENFHATWNAVLTNQAIYLLSKSDSLDVPHEENNLVRIIKLLQNSGLSTDQKADVKTELTRKIDRNGNRPGLDLTHRMDDLNKWQAAI